MSEHGTVVLLKQLLLRSLSKRVVAPSAIVSSCTAYSLSVEESISTGPVALIACSCLRPSSSHDACD